MATTLKSGSSSSSAQRLLLLKSAWRCSKSLAEANGASAVEASLLPCMLLRARILIMASSIMLCSVRPSRPRTRDALPLGRPALAASEAERGKKVTYLRQESRNGG